MQNDTNLFYENLERSSEIIDTIQNITISTKNHYLYDYRKVYELELCDMLFLASLSEELNRLYHSHYFTILGEHITINIVDTNKNVKHTIHAPIDALRKYYTKPSRFIKEIIEVETDIAKEI